MNKSLFLLIVFSLCLVGSVFAVEVNDSFIINSSLLPVNGTSLLSLDVNPNQSLYVYEVNGSGFEYFNVSFPSLVSTVNVSSVNISFNYSFFDVPVFSNYSFYRSFLVNTSYNNLSVFYDLFFDLTYDSKITSNVGFWMYLEQGVGGSVNVSQNLLPKSYTIPVLLKGVSGGVVNLSCSSWFTCPESVVFGVDNRSRFNITLGIPKVDWGSYYPNVTFVGTNNSVSAVWNVSVLKPEFVGEEFVISPKCLSPDLSFDARVSCYEGIIDFYYEQQKEMISFYRTLDWDCENTTVTEYVMSGSISEDILHGYDICKVDRDSCRSSLGNTNSYLNDCQSSLSSVNGELTVAQFSLVEQSKNDSLSCISRVESALQESKSKRRSFAWKVFWWLFGIVFVVVLVWFVKRYRRNNLVGFG